MCSCDYGESPEFYNAEWRKAGKAHRCEECRGTIQKGELHYYVSGKWEGDVDQFRICARCEALHRAHSAAEATMGEAHCRAPLGELRSTIRECTQEGGRAYAVALQAEFRKLRAPALGAAA